MLFINTCWFLCAMFFLLHILASLVSVVPEVQAMHTILCFSLLFLCIFCGVVAWLLRRKFKKNPDAAIFKKKSLVVFLIGIGLLLTFFLLSGSFA